jgi:hypothetical protein
VPARVSGSGSGSWAGVDGVWGVVVMVGCSEGVVVSLEGSGTGVAAAAGAGEGWVPVRSGLG